MTEKPKSSYEKESTSPSRPDIDREKVLAGNVFQADALKHSVKGKRPKSLRDSTKDIETEVSKLNKKVIRMAKAGESIDV